MLSGWPRPNFHSYFSHISSVFDTIDYAPGETPNNQSINQYHRPKYPPSKATFFGCSIRYYFGWFRSYLSNLPFLLFSSLFPVPRSLWWVIKHFQLLIPKFWMNFLYTLARFLVSSFKRSLITIPQRKQILIIALSFPCSLVLFLISSA